MINSSALLGARLGMNVPLPRPRADAVAAPGKGSDLVATLCSALTAAATMAFRVTQSAVDASYFG